MSNKKMPPAATDDKEINPIDKIAQAAQFVKGTKADRYAAADILQEVKDDGLQAAICEMIAARADQKNLLTVRGLKMLIRRLNKIDTDPRVQTAMLEKAITGGWLTVYPLSDMERKIIVAQPKKVTSYDMDKIRQKFNVFED